LFKLAWNIKSQRLEKIFFYQSIIYISFFILISNLNEHEKSNMWHIKHINIRHSYSRIILVQLRSYICNSISRLFAKHTDAHHAGSARELKSYALYMYTNEKSHNACGRKWIRWKRNRSDSTDYGSRDITHKTGLHQVWIS